MCRWYLLAAAFACVLGGSWGQIISWGSCPTVQVQQNFNIARYMGPWYEQKRYFAVFEAGMECVSAEYTLETGGVVKVNNTGYRRISGRYSSAIGDAIVEDPREPAKLGVRFSEYQPRGDYWVLSTDYDTYTVIWSCTPFARFFNTQFAWILTRNAQGVPDSKMAELYSLLDGYGIHTWKLLTTDQSPASCPM
ncbi:apolipoprotein D-like [Mya arenaria]|uniref:apolipoprotein D-like n=1 Tax=Mya arenaria TaxID=6604 RepID=UPI0022DF44EE|nr:apolipoprotein D-like [Mya arenaria]